MKRSSTLKKGLLSVLTIFALIGVGLFIGWSLVPYPLKVSLFMGWGLGRDPIHPTILIDNESFRKERMTADEIQDLHKESVQFDYGDETQGYFVKNQKEVSLLYTPNYPVSHIQCVTKEKDIVWTHSTEDWPSNRVTDMLIVEERQESVILVLLDGDKAYYLVFLRENGQTRNIVTLTNTGDKRWYHMAAFSWQHELYIAATSGGNDIGIFDSKGTMLTTLTALGETISIAALAMTHHHEQPFVAIFANHMSTTRSSILFLLSEQWNVVYQEVLETGKWLGKKKGKTGDELILATYCLRGADCTQRECFWKYSFADKQG